MHLSDPAYRELLHNLSACDPADRRYAAGLQRSDELVAEADGWRARAAGHYVNGCFGRAATCYREVAQATYELADLIAALANNLEQREDDPLPDDLADKVEDEVGYYTLLARSGKVACSRPASPQEQ
jgi:hypothetical protein